MNDFMHNLYINAPKTMSRHMVISFIGTLLCGATYFYISLSGQSNFFLLMLQAFIFFVFLFITDFYNSAYIYNKYKYDDEVDMDNLMFSLHTFALLFIVIIIATVSLCSIYLSTNLFSFIPKEIFAFIPTIFFIVAMRIQYILQAKKVIGY